jgi:hypothetical protein
MILEILSEDRPLIFWLKSDESTSKLSEIKCLYRPPSHNAPFLSPKNKYIKLLPLTVTCVNPSSALR